MQKEWTGRQFWDKRGIYFKIAFYRKKGRKRTSTRCYERMTDVDLKRPLTLFLSSPSLSTQPLVLSLAYAFLEAFLAIWALVRLCFLANFRFFKNLGSQPENIPEFAFFKKTPNFRISIRYLNCWGGVVGGVGNKTHEKMTSQAIPQSKELSFLTSFVGRGLTARLKITNPNFLHDYGSCLF
jgi:hypothetical protein